MYFREKIFLAFEILILLSLLVLSIPFILSFLPTNDFLTTDNTFFSVVGDIAMGQLNLFAYKNINSIIVYPYIPLMIFVILAFYFYNKKKRDLILHSILFFLIILHFLLLNLTFSWLAGV